MMSFEEVYDELMDPAVYDGWLQWIVSQGLEKPTTLDLAAGTGRMSEILTQHGYSVTAFDLSEDMLAMASARQVDNEIFYPLIQGDMRDLSSLGAYDLVICTLDSLNYLESFADVEKVFAQVYEHLNAGGLFLFDVHSEYQMDEVFPGYQYHADLEGSFFAWTSFALRERTVEHQLSLFKEVASGLFERENRIIIERTYSLESFLEGLRQAGFSSMECLADFGKSEVHEETQRWFFKARKG